LTRCCRILANQFSIAGVRAECIDERIGDFALFKQRVLCGGKGYRTKIGWNSNDAMQEEIYLQVLYHLL